MEPSRWHFELWSANGLLLADLTGRSKNRRIVQARNQPDEIIWQVDLAEFEEYARKLNMLPSVLLKPGQTEVRVRRGENYLAGGQISYRNVHISPGEQDVEIRAKGFLALFASRYTQNIDYYDNLDGTVIAGQLIENYQLGFDNDFGVTLGIIEVLNDPHFKTFKSNEVLDVLQRICNLYDFDMEITHDKVFNAYKRIGSNRPEIIFSYPGNIREINSPLDATNIENVITVNGSGSGTEGNNETEVSDANSIAEYKARYAIINYSEVENEEDLENHGKIRLEEWSMPFEIPSIVVDGNKKPFVTDYKVGDSIRLECTQYETLNKINGMFRVERRTIAIDDNDQEVVTLEFSV